MRFILVDDILELEPGKHIRAVKTMSPDDELFEDHFPGFPVVPGVLLVEMMAQAAGKCLDAEDPGRGKAMLIRINHASFRRWVRPGERVEILASVGASTPAAGSVSARLEVGGVEAAQASLYFSFVSRSEFSIGYVDKVLERYQRRRHEDAGSSR